MVTPWYMRESDSATKFRSGVQKFLVSLEKGFKDKHRGNLSRFINAKQSESRAKVHPPEDRVGRFKKEYCRVGISGFEPEFS
jgi:hypothetical protein